jgi:hypothetical protein
VIFEGRKNGIEAEVSGAGNTAFDTPLAPLGTLADKWVELRFE